jgi:hypothetical protein
LSLKVVGGIFVASMLIAGLISVVSMVRERGAGTEETQNDENLET